MSDTAEDAKSLHAPRVLRAGIRQSRCVGHCLAVALLVAATAAHASRPPRVDLVKVDKSERRLWLMRGDAIVATFPIALGGNPVGHKQREGDRRTPEGRYVLDFRKRDSAFFRALHVSYPNAEDIARAKRAGVPPGSAIMIHGQPNGMGALSAVTQRRDWTDGCIALSNADMQKVWNLVRVPTPIEIVP